VVENIMWVLSGIYTGFQTEKDFSKSVNIWRSYRQWFRRSGFSVGHGAEIWQTRESNLGYAW